jgi:RHS repeat-associated protein
VVAERERTVQRQPIPGATGGDPDISIGPNYRTFLFGLDTLGGTVLNQVEDVFNGLGQLTGVYQANSGAVTTSGPTPTPETRYAYSDPTTGSLVTAIFYPSGREISLSYGDNGSLSDAIGWVSSIADANSLGAHTLATYTYLGNGAMVGQSHPQTGANEAITFDNFGNIADLNWTNSSGTSTDHFGFGYDVNGNVLYKRNFVNAADSELYHANGTTPGYDDLNRLTTFARGTLSASVTDGTLDTVSSPGTTQSWALDAVGNQTAVTTDGTTQSKTQNAQNQTTSVSGTGLGYDANGATTTDKQGRNWAYDAWGDAVSVKDSSGNPIETDGFDAMGRRITVTTYSGGTPTTTDVYYSTSGQVLEKDQSGSVVSQIVYGAGYVNSVIEVDQATSTPGTLDQRIYVQQDANYNVTSITDTSGTVLERFIYSPYGEQTVLNPDGTIKGDGTPASSSYNLPIGFQGMLFDPVLSDNLTPNRVYDPMLGTWTQADPAGYVNGTDTYQFTVGSPVAGTDPSGLADQPTTKGSGSGDSGGSDFGSGSSAPANPTAEQARDLAERISWNKNLGGKRTDKEITDAYWDEVSREEHDAELIEASETELFVDMADNATGKDWLFEPSGTRFEPDAAKVIALMKSHTWNGGHYDYVSVSDHGGSRGACGLSIGKSMLNRMSFTYYNAIQKNGAPPGTEQIAQPEMEFLEALRASLSSNATVRFVTCNSEDLRPQLQAFFDATGKHINLQLFSGLVTWTFAGPRVIGNGDKTGSK